MAKIKVNSRFSFARNCILARKLAVTKFATSASRKTLWRINVAHKNEKYFPNFYRKLFVENRKFIIGLKANLSRLSECDFFVFRKFWLALCLHYGKYLSKNFVENRKFIIGLKVNLSRLSECDFFVFRKFWLVLGLRY